MNQTGGLGVGSPRAARRMRSFTPSMLAWGMRVLFLALTLALSLPALAQEDPVVAQVGEEVIGKSQFDLRFRLFAKSALRQLGLPESEESLKLLAPYRATYLEALAEERALLRVARAQGFWPHPDRVEAQIEQLKAAFPSEEAFLSALQGAGVPDLATYRLLLSEAMALEALEGHYRTKLRSPPPPSRSSGSSPPSTATAPSTVPGTSWCPPWRRPRRSWPGFRRASPSPRWPRRSPRTRAPGRPGGSWAASRRAPTSPPLRRPSSLLKPGQVSAPVQTEYGFHLILLEKVLPPGRYPLEEALPDLEEALKAKAWEKLAKALIRGVPIRLFPERL
jgi:peptidyl-prolyl cis-trans isomerase C